MQPTRIAKRLAANAEVYRHLLADVSPEQARWKPAPEKWSQLEVVCHLADEERDDFRRRLDLTLHHPGELWPPNDPAGWAVERRYNERNLAEVLADFLQERARSTEWLGGLRDVQLGAAYDHPRSGKISAGDLLASWVAHDLIHIRQITRLHYEYLSATSLPYSPEYAGPW